MPAVGTTYVSRRGIQRQAAPANKTRACLSTIATGKTYSGARTIPSSPRLTAEALTTCGTSIRQPCLQPCPFPTPPKLKAVLGPQRIAHDRKTFLLLLELDRHCRRRGPQFVQY